MRRKPQQTLVQLFQRDTTGQFLGKDAYGTKKTEYLKKLVFLNVRELKYEIEHILEKWIGLGSKRDDFFWRMNACYFLCVLTERVHIFQLLYKKLYNGN